ncbi:calcium/sodium antiporter [Pontivivens insulae]|uniref:Inner membrane protein YrbG n=1 Tax=Pontivivens insulae TaxID=1639689 RepID=A0A2R8A6D7_9RHOB|nr:calcium/sodium antiporter [Pontivivens insulae]RED17913.1 cation:H+ antiporter [Pontivivens insulae]SPF27803.1 Inner membrane protein YrbG [Pontivivens insulae]
MDLLFAAGGLVLLVIAGDILVRGAVALSLKLGIPALIISLTIVAFGTSAPELLIAIQAALDGVPGIAFGNVVGSNIANVLLVIGLPAFIAIIKTTECDTRRSFLQMLAATIVFIALCAMGPLHYWHGVVMLALLGYILLDAYRAAKAARHGDMEPEDELAELEDADPDMSGIKIAIFIILGIAGLPLGADLLIDGARGIALAYGVSDAVIGLTLVAIGTSLPELATTIMATIRRQADVVLGNVIGSNLFNLLAIMGIASFFGPLPLPDGFLTFDLIVMLGTSLLLIPFVLHWTNVTRVWGVLFVGLYVAYVALLASTH